MCSSALHCTLLVNFLSSNVIEGISFVRDFHYAIPLPSDTLNMMWFLLGTIDSVFVCMYCF